MTHEEIKNWYEKQIEWYNKEVGWCDKAIENLTRELEQNRKEDREMVEWVWSRGVVTKWEMKTYGNKYEGTETHKNLLARRREYLRRKRANKEIKRYEKLLAEM